MFPIHRLRKTSSRAFLLRAFVSESAAAELSAVLVVAGSLRLFRMRSHALLEVFFSLERRSLPTGYIRERAQEGWMGIELAPDAVNEFMANDEGDHAIHNAVSGYLLAILLMLFNLIGHARFFRLAYSIDPFVVVLIVSRNRFR
jgi:hypothetical protein